MPFPAKPGSPAGTKGATVEYNQAGTAAHIQVLTKDSPFASPAMHAVNGPLKDLAHSSAPAGTKALVGGGTAALADIHLVDYRVRVLDSAKGTGSVTRVLIDSTAGDRTWTTIGVSEDIIEASWQALSDSIVYGLLRTSEPAGA